MFSCVYLLKDLGGGLLHWACMTTVTTEALRSFDIVISKHIDLLLYLIVEEKILVDTKSTIDQSTPLMVIQYIVNSSLSFYY
jgi:hypothetical protein